MKHILTLLAGALFGIGIAISGMANPAKVVNFFDLAGTWDPSLIFVMGGALLTTLIGYRLVFRVRSAPLFEPQFYLPTKHDVDPQLIGGSAVFGIGWGISGFCPGGALPALGLGHWQVPVFVAAMAFGIMIARTVLRGRSPVAPA
ncbi:MAG: YeeE/YedE family protein [Pseudomonadota bacterium]